MTAYRATTDLTVSGSDATIAPGLLLEELEFALASNAVGPLSSAAYVEAVELQQEFLASVAANVGAMIGRGNTSETVFAFLEPLLARL